MRKLLALVAMLLLAAPALGQSVQQSGTVTPNHSVRWITNGVIGDAGTLSNPMVSGYYALNNGEGVCTQSSQTTTANWVRLCLSSITNGGGFLTITTAGNGVAGFGIKVNGNVQGLATVALPVTATHVSCFANTAGTLQDCGDLAVASDGGVIVGTPAGGSEGTGTVNAQGLYVNGLPVQAPVRTFYVGPPSGSDNRSHIQTVLNAAVTYTGTTPFPHAIVQFDCANYPISDYINNVGSNVVLTGCPYTGTTLTVTTGSGSCIQISGTGASGAPSSFVYNNGISDIYCVKNVSPTGGFGINIYYAQLTRLNNIQISSFMLNIGIQRAGNTLINGLITGTAYQVSGQVGFDWNGNSAANGDPTDIGGNPSSVCTNCWLSLVTAAGYNDGTVLKMHGAYLTDYSFLNPIIEGGATAVELDGSSATATASFDDGFFTNLISDQWQNRGVYVHDMPAYSVVTFNGGWTLPGTGSAGANFTLVNTNNVQIVNHQFYNVANSGAAGVATSGVNSQLVVTGGSFTNLPTPLSLTGVSRSTISNNVISNPATAAGPPIHYAAGTMITLSGTSVGNSFTGNTLSGFATTGFIIGSSATGNVFSSNTVQTANIVTPISDSATDGSNQYGTSNVGFTGVGFTWANHSGTAGGIPWFNTANTIANSGAFTTHGVVYSQGSSAPTTTAAGTTGQVFIGNTGSAPSWAALSSIGVTTFSAGTTGLTPNSATSGAITLAGTLNLASGGTNNALSASNGGVVWSDASKLNILSGTATANLPLLSGASATPSWATIAYPGSATSGGIPYFSSTTIMASSGALTANAPVIGGGAGAAPSVGSRSGNTTVFATTSGSLTSTHFAAFDASGNIVDGGAVGVSTFSAGSTGLTPNSATGGAVTLAGTLAVANGGTGDTGTAWTTYTPTMSCGAGSGTWAAAGRYKTLGKTVWIEMTLTLSIASTCTGNVTASLPNTVQAGFAALVRENGLTGLAYQLWGTSAATTVNISSLTNTAVNPATNSSFITSFVYESQ